MGDPGTPPPASPPDTRDLAGPLAALAVVGTLAAGIALVAWRSAAQSRAPTTPPSPVAPTPIAEMPPLPDFALTERSGRTVTRADLLGHVWVVGFVFTRCPSTCPLITASIRQLHRQITDPRVRFLCISVDPEWDTPEVLRVYADDHGADRDRWWFVSGDKTAVHALVRDGFRLALAEVPGPERVIHSERLAIVDAAGQVRAWAHGTDPESVAGVAGLVADLLAEK